MTTFNKILKLSNQIASSILKGEEPKTVHDSDFFEETDKQYILENITKPELLAARAQQLHKVNKKKGWKKIQQEIGTPVRKLIFWRYAAAAAVVLFCTTFYLTKGDLSFESGQSESVVVKTSIVPGTDKATLILANGQTVVLEKGQKYNSNNVHSNGSEIIYENDLSSKKAIGYNYLTIPRGGQFFIKLPDGSQVWLNSESQLKFPTRFEEGQTRQVELVYGEAYFDISPSTAHKGARFNVSTAGQNVEVLGTEFNIKAYQDENSIFTTLVEGKINMSNSVVSKILEPSDQSVLNRSTNSVVMNRVDVYNEISWKEGVFTFQNMTLKDIMKVLSRWYDVDVVFNNKKLEKVTFNGILDKNQKIEEILIIINKTNKIPYEIKEKTITFN
nr:FecR domain-containing protein [uncultured Flavobacterium sp.]